MAADHVHKLERLKELYERSERALETAQLRGADHVILDRLCRRTIAARFRLAACSREGWFVDKAPDQIHRLRRADLTEWRRRLCLPDPSARRRRPVAAPMRAARSERTA